MATPDDTQPIPQHKYEALTASKISKTSTRLRMTAAASLQSLPFDLFEDNLLPYLSYADLVRLNSTSKSLSSNLSTPSTWNAYLRHQNYTDIVQSRYLSSLPLRLRAALGHRADVGWEKHIFKAQSMFPQRWQRKCLPRLEIDTEFIAVGVGADMHIQWIPNATMFNKSQTTPWMVYNLGTHGSQDITDIVPLPGTPTEFIIGQAHGSIRHLEFSKDTSTFTIKRVFQHGTAIIRSLSMTSEYLVALSSTSSTAHKISFYPLQSLEDNAHDGAPLSPVVSPIHIESQTMNEPWTPANHPVIPPFITADHPTRPWNALFLSPTQLAIGSTSPSALGIYDFSPDTTEPLKLSRQLFSHPAKLSGLTDTTPYSKTSIYAMHQYAPNLLLTGWYHGPANIHDLRLADSYPVLSLNDPLDDGAAYSLSTDGGNRILVGGANHALVKIFDVRMPEMGWSIYLGRERSPVYAIKGEHSRIFAATEGTVWECDLGYKHKPRTYDDGNWRNRSLPVGRTGGAMGGRRWRMGWWGREEEEKSEGQVRLHYGEEKLYREDGSEVGKSITTGVFIAA